MVTSKLKSATVVGAMLPLVQKISNGEKLADQMREQNDLLEEMLVKIASTKKHPDNEEFINLMKEFEQGCEEAAKLELKALSAVIKEVEEEKLIAAAAEFEKCKLETSLTPGKIEA